MKNILAIIGTTLLLGCSPSRSEMQSSIDHLSTQLQASEQSLEKEKEGRKRDIEVLCALVGESLTDGQVRYVGNEKYLFPDGTIQEMDDMESMCLEMIDIYENTILEREMMLVELESRKASE